MKACGLNQPCLLRISDVRDTTDTAKAHAASDTADATLYGTAPALSPTPLT
jgi:hypothetical protein